MKKQITLIVLIMLAIVTFTFLFFHFGFDAVQDYILSLGILAPVAFMALMAIAIIISPIPSIPLDIWAGSVWGGFWGGLYSTIGALAGAIIAFQLSRRFGRAVAERYLGKIMELCNDCYSKSLPWFIFLTRLLPIFQFDIISYASGLTRVRLWKFALATFLGMIPVTFLLSYYGESIVLGSVWVSIGFTVLIIIAMYIMPKYIREKMTTGGKK